MSKHIRIPSASHARSSGSDGSAGLSGRHSHERHDRRDARLTPPVGPRAGVPPGGLQSGGGGHHRGPVSNSSGVAAWPHAGWCQPGPSTRSSHPQSRQSPVYKHQQGIPSITAPTSSQGSEYAYAPQRLPPPPQMPIADTTAEHSRFPPAWPPDGPPRLNATKMKYEIGCDQDGYRLVKGARVLDYVRFREKEHVVFQFEWKHLGVRDEFTIQAPRRAPSTDRSQPDAASREWFYWLKPGNMVDFYMKQRFSKRNMYWKVTSIKKHYDLPAPDYIPLLMYK